jgi:hypothetical protein
MTKLGDYRDRFLDARMKMERLVPKADTNRDKSKMIISRQVGPIPRSVQGAKSPKQPSTQT